MVAANRFLFITAADPLARGGLLAVLSPLRDWEILGSGDPSSTLAYFDANSAEIPDVLLWDTGWQPQSQLHLLRDFIAYHPGQPILTLTDTPTDAARLWDTGVTGILLRSASLDQLAAALHAVAAGLAVWSPDLAGELNPPSADPGPLIEPLTEPLTPREMDVLELLARGLPNKTIARQLGISEHTVKFHMNSILAKLNAQSRTEAVINAGRAGIIQV